jgi:hypothetical protein
MELDTWDRDSWIDTIFEDSESERHGLDVEKIEEQ